MNKTMIKGACITGALLSLTIAANAMNATVPGNSATAGKGNGALSMAQTQPGEPHKIFSGVGIVTAIEPAGTLTINHQPIEGLMPAMEMTFSVNPRALTKGVRPGDKIEFSVEGKTYTIVALKVVGHTE